MKMETGRLYIRPFQPGDLEELYALLSDREVMAQLEASCRG